MKYTVSIIVVLFVILLGTFHKIGVLQEDCKRHSENMEALMGKVEKYKVRDSLSAASVQVLRLTLDEFKSLREQDAKLIKDLKAKNRDLSGVNTTQTQTILALQSQPKDTIVIRDSVVVPAIAVHCGDAWYDFDGLLTQDSFSGKLVNRDSLIIVESVKYKRFLGFLWKTSKVRDRRVEVVSRNPHTQIVNVQHTLIQN